jgi:ligand-binding sensor domain-containing protein
MTRSSLALVLIASLFGEVAAAQQQTRGRLPLESVTTSQGLPSDSITTITTDSRGYVWFGTLDGLSRYDGERFVNYTTDDGLPDRMIWSIAEDARGGIWVGTFNGAARMTPTATRGRSLFARVATPRGKEGGATAVIVDRSGTIWSQCNDDLCFANDGRLQVDDSFHRAGGRDVNDIVSGVSGDLWLATTYGLMHRERDAVWHHFDVQPNHGGDDTDSVVCDADGRVWITNGFGVIVYTPKEGDTDTRSLAERAGPALTPGARLRMPAPGRQSPLQCRSPRRSFTRGRPTSGATA